MSQQKGSGNEPPPAGLRKRLFARWYNKVMEKYEAYISERKQMLFADLPPTVIEIGPGTGANLRYLLQGCTWIGIEPNPFMHSQLREKAARHGVEAECRIATAEGIREADASVDAVLCTLVLCSVRDPQQVLTEVLRVLKPGGGFYFIEHVAASHGTWLRRWQRIMRPIWVAIADGCHPDRATRTSIQSAAFRSVELEEFRVPFPPALPFVSPHIAGVARK